MDILSDFQSDDQDGAFYVSKDIVMTEHIGTHMDAPHHFGKTAWDLASIPIENFIVPVVKIDVREKCAENRDYLLTVQDLKDWEEKHGKVPENAVILMETGWGAKYKDTEAYYGELMSDNIFWLTILCPKYLKYSKYTYSSWK